MQVNKTVWNMVSDGVCISRHRLLRITNMTITLSHHESTNRPFLLILGCTTRIRLLIVDARRIVLPNGIALFCLLKRYTLVATRHHHQSRNIYQYVENLPFHTSKNEKKAPLLYGTFTESARVIHSRLIK